jgi:hypothetical protein
LSLPGERPAEKPKACNYDRDLLKAHSDVGITDQGVADPSIVFKSWEPKKIWRYIGGQNSQRTAARKEKKGWTY